MSENVTACAMRTLTLYILNLPYFALVLHCTLIIHLNMKEHRHKEKSFKELNVFTKSYIYTVFYYVAKIPVNFKSRKVLNFFSTWFCHRNKKTFIRVQFTQLNPCVCGCNNMLQNIHSMFLKFLQTAVSKPLPTISNCYRTTEKIS